MAHEVTMDADVSKLLGGDVIFNVKKDNAVLGDLTIRKGAIEWRPKGNYRNTVRLSWVKFAALMEEKLKKE
ncbi:MAG: hypothetical protein O2944_08465 [Proteobacteria bacterium]|nr:hypothetical protein [Pseudomonadota bacterium]